jgi:hypothetical protein
VLGLFSVVQPFGILLIGFEVSGRPVHQEYFQLFSAERLRSVMFSPPLSARGQG